MGKTFLEVGKKKLFIGSFNRGWSCEPHQGFLTALPDWDCIGWPSCGLTRSLEEKEDQAITLARGAASCELEMDLHVNRFVSQSSDVPYQCRVTADVNHLGSAGAQTLDFRSMSALSRALLRGLPWPCISALRCEAYPWPIYIHIHAYIHTYM